MINYTTDKFLRKIGAEYCVRTQEIQLVNGDFYTYEDFRREEAKYPKGTFSLIDFIIEKLQE